MRAHHGFYSRGLHGLNPDDRLDEELLARRAAIEFFAYRVAQSRTDRDCDQNVEWDRGKDDQVRLAEYENSTAMKMNVDKRSSAENRPWPVRKPRIVSSSRIRATV